MPSFWIDYSTSVCIEAETTEEAVEKFWAGDEGEVIAYAEIQIDSVEEGEV